MVTPPAPAAPEPLPPAPPASSAPPPPPLPAVKLRWQIEDDFVQGAAALLGPRPMDWPSLAEPLPAAQRRTYRALSRPEPPREKEALALAVALERGASRLRGLEAAAVWLALGALVERWGLSSPEETSLRWAERAYQRATELAPVSEKTGAEARYRLALALGKLRRKDQGLAALQELLTSSSELQPEAAARLGSLLERSGPAEAAAAYRRGLESQIPASLLVRGALVHGLLVTSYQQGNHRAALGGALDFLRGFRGSGPPSLAAEGALRVAADSLEHLGVGTALAGPFAPEASEALLRLAWRALRRGDSPLAERIAAHVLDGAPLDWQAPAALRIAIAAAEHRKDQPLADERKARLFRDFGPSSPWAEAQRLGRGKDGWPSDTVIAASSKPPPTPPQESPEAQLAGRLKALVRLCVEPLAWRRHRLPPEGLQLHLQVAALADAPSLQVQLSATDASWEPIAACLRNHGDFHLKGAPAVGEATVTWEP